MLIQWIYCVILSAILFHILIIISATGSPFKPAALPFDMALKVCLSRDPLRWPWSWNQPSIQESPCLAWGYQRQICVGEALPLGRHCLGSVSRKKSEKRYFTRDPLTCFLTVVRYVCCVSLYNVLLFFILLKKSYGI